MQNPEIAGTEYRQGTLAGYEVREYLLEKWGRKCVYCGAENVPLQIDHIAPRSRGGTDRVSNLTLACGKCNQAKGNTPAGEFLAGRPDVLARLLAHAKTPLKDAAAVNSVRWALFRALKGSGPPLETASGGRTKWNRIRFGIPKTHALDAACAGSTDGVEGWNLPVLGIRCMGRGAYKRTRLTADGFPRGYLMRSKKAFGFQTGDMVAANIAGAKHAGRVAVRASGGFIVQTRTGKLNASHKNCRLLQRADGYQYRLQQGGGASSPA
jgi:hypothetical protein